METLLILVSIVWLVGFLFLSGDPGHLISRRPLQKRVWLWLTIIIWPITLTYLWVKHKLILRDL